MQIENISNPNDTMTFTVSNTLLVDGFSDSTAYIRMVCDINDDGTKEIIGGKDSLWWAPEDDVLNRKYFIGNDGIFSFEGQVYLTKFTRINRQTRIYVSSTSDTSIYGFEYDIDLETLLFDKSSNPYSEHLWLINDPNHEQLILFNSEDYLRFQKELFLFSATDSLRAILDDDGGIGVYKPGYHLNEHMDIQFISLAAIDLNLDGNPDILAIDDSGELYAFDKNLILMNGFTIEGSYKSPILSADVVGDNHPEIAVESKNGDRIVILNYFGETLYEIAKSQTDEIQYFGNMNDYSYLATSFNLWKFDEATDPMGNEWSHQNGNPYQSRTLALEYSVTESDHTQLLVSDRCYAYPNPARNGLVTLRIQTEFAESIEVKIYDLAGYYVDTFNIDPAIQAMPNEIVWNVSNVESGVYFANVTANSGEKTETKIIKIAVIH